VGFLFWRRIVEEILVARYLQDFAIEIRERKMEAKGNCHDYFDENARHAAGDR
jgi:hypothetical protein